MKTFILKQPFLLLIINRLLSFFICSLLLLNFSATVAQVNASPSGSELLEQTLKQKNDQAPALPSSTSSQWYSQAIAYLTEREYFFQPFEKENWYSAANHAQKLGFLFTPSGYTVKILKKGKTMKKTGPIILMYRRLEEKIQGCQSFH